MNPFTSHAQHPQGLVKPSREPLISDFLPSHWLYAPCTPKPGRAWGGSRPAVYSSFTDGAPQHRTCHHVPPRWDRESLRTCLIRRREAEAKGRKLVALRSASLRSKAVVWGDERRWGGRGGRGRGTEHRVWGRSSRSYCWDVGDLAEGAEGDQRGAGAGTPWWTDMWQSRGSAGASPLQGQVPGAVGPQQAPRGLGHRDLHDITERALIPGRRLLLPGLPVGRSGRDRGYSRPNPPLSLSFCEPVTA